MKIDAMSNRNLTDFFSPKSSVTASKPVSPPVEIVDLSPVEKVKQKRKRSKVNVREDTDDDFEEEPILPPLNGNSITKYFSPVARPLASQKPKNSQTACVLTVKAQVHGSPKKCAPGNEPMILKRLLKKKRKKKSGITSSQADKIELISSETLPVIPEIENVPDLITPVSPTRDTQVVQSADKILPASKVPKWKMKLKLKEDTKSTGGETTDGSDAGISEGPRRSTRIRARPTTLQVGEIDDEEPETKRAVKKRRKKDSEPICTPSSDVGQSDSDLEIVNDKVAPIFLKKQKKEEYRIIQKAKQEFLFSGVPEVLKQQVAIQQALEERPVEIFPRVSHVTQAGSRPWRLPFPTNLESLLRPLVPKPINQPVIFLASLNDPSTISSTPPCNQATVAQALSMDWRFCKDWISQLKENHALSFPFFRTLRNLLPKSSKSNGESLWTEIYAPSSSADVLPNNRQPMQQLKKWLNQWKAKAGEEVEREPKKKKKKKSGKRKRLDSNSSSDMETEVVDEKSNGSWNPEELLGNCLLLMGPSSSGKTAAVYALAEELGYNVLEVNASSRRNGRTVLSHLHEATQSHSVNNSIFSPTTPTANGLNKLFFGAATKSDVKSAPNPDDTKPSAFSLVLFEDVDIVFESEDESFYSALTTLIQTSKRPVVLTLGTTESRALDAVREKIKSDFDVLYFTSPDWLTASCHLWSTCLAQGYPLEWNALSNWVGRSRKTMEFDMRGLLHDLQLMLEHHPLRLKLDFTQLQLKNEEASGNTDGLKKRSSFEGRNSPSAIQLIKLPHPKRVKEWPYAVELQPPRYVYDSTEGAIVLSGKHRKTFSRILANDGIFETESDSNQGMAEEEELKTKPTKEKWEGDLTPLARCMEARSYQDLFMSCHLREDLSWNDSSILENMADILSERSSSLMEIELNQGSIESIQDGISRRKNEESTRDGIQSLLLSSISRTGYLQRSSHSSDVLPYLRSMCRSDVERNVGKRRRKPASGLTDPTTRLPTLDLVLPTPTVLQLANSFYS